MIKLRRHSSIHLSRFRILGASLFMILSSGVPLALIAACGSGNVFSKAVKRSESEKAQAALESGDVDSAIETLNSYLRDHPDDAGALAMLANAYLKKSGVDLLKIGSSISSGEQNQTNWRTVSSALPAGTDENVTNVKAAVEALSSIPPEQRTQEQNYQLAIAQTTLAVTVAKKAAGDSSGQLSAEKVDQMSDSDAMTIYNALKGSKDATSALTTQDSGLKKVASISDGVESQSGSTEADRLRSYLKTQL